MEDKMEKRKRGAYTKKAIHGKEAVCNYHHFPSCFSELGRCFLILPHFYLSSCKDSTFSNNEKNIYIGKMEGARLKKELRNHSTKSVKML